MVKIVFKSPFQQHPLLFSFQVKKNCVLSSAQAKNLGVILDSFLPFTSSNPVDPKVSTFRVYTDSNYFSPPQLLALLAAKRPSFLPWKITTAPCWTPRFYLCPQQGVLQRAARPFKNISQIEPFRSFLSHSIIDSQAPGPPYFP